MASARTFAYDVDATWEQLPPGLVHTDVSAVDVDSQDRVFLFTRRDHRVIIYEPDGRFVSTWGEGVFANAHGLTIAPDDSVYCVDNKDHTVRKFTPDGVLLLTLGIPGQCSQTGYDGRHPETVVRSAEPFNGCANVAVAPDGDLFIADGYGNARVHRFSPDGRLLQSWGEPGAGPGQFQLPHGICVTPEGVVLVADRENDRIQLFTLDGAYLREWNDVHRPSMVQLDGQGLVYVTEMAVRPGDRLAAGGTARDEQPGRLSIFHQDGTLLHRWGGPERCAPGNFVAPHGLAVDSQGSLYVAEVTWVIAAQKGLVPPDCHQVQKFSPR